MSMKKRILSFVIMLILILSVYPMADAAANVISINAEKVMAGGEGVAYHDSGADGKLETPWVSGYSYMVIMRGSEWLKYKINVSEKGNYRISAFVGRANGGEATLWIDNETTGVTVSGRTQNTGTWGKITEFVIADIELVQGENIIKIYNRKSDFPHYIDKLEFTQVFAPGEQIDFSKKSGAYKQSWIPGILEAENYDIGTTASYSNDGINSGRAYRKNDVMDTYASGKKIYLQLNKDEFVNYTFNCENDGVYNLYADFIANGEVKIYIDKNEMPVTASALETTGKTFASAVYFKKGEHSLKVVSDKINKLDRFIIEASKETKDVFDPEKYYEVKEEEVKNEVANEIYKEFYVSLSGSDESDGSKEKPFKTIKRAQEEVRKFNQDMTGDIYIYIEPGYYKLDETLNFTPEDGGKDNFNVVYMGSSPFLETVIGGGNEITGWEKTDNELYKAYYDSPNDFRQLYINDVPAIRARSKYLYKPSYYKKTNSKYTYDGMKFPKKNFPSEFSDVSRMETITTVEWLNYRNSAKSVEYTDTHVLIEMDQPWFNSIASKTKKNNVNFYFENDMAFLDEPGEFYYDMKNKTVYYYPREGEVLENVYAADKEFFINAQGTKENNIKNLHFERLSFKYGTWYRPNIGYKHSQGHLVSGIPDVEEGPVPAQLEFKHIDGLKIKDCRFVGLGSTAIGITNGVTNSKIIGNVFKELSGSAIIAGMHTHEQKMPAGHKRCANVDIKNNVIRRAAREFQDSPAIFLFYVKNFDISHNDIEEACYSGISVGWGWGVTVLDAGSHTVSYNRIVDVMGPTHDGGHIYTLSPIPEMKIFRNYLEKTHDWRGGLYFDNGSAYMEAWENVSAVGGNWVWAREGAQLAGIKLYNNWHYSKTQSIDTSNNNVEAYGNKLEPLGEQGIWSAEAQAVIDGAGVEAPYKRLLKEAELPDFAKGYLRDIPNGVYSSRNDWISPATYVDFLDFDAATPNVASNGNIGNTVTGEWCEYDVKIPESGMYKFSIKAGNGSKKQSPKVKLYIDGKVADEGLPVPMWVENKWTVGQIDGKEYFLEKGIHRVRIEHKDGNFMFGPFKFASGNVSDATDPEYDEGKLPSQLLEKENDVFSDLINHWAKNSVNSLYDMGIIKGVTETQFAPQREITLKETVLLAMRVSGYNENTWQEKLNELGMSDYIENADKSVSREVFSDIIMKFYTDKKGVYSSLAQYDCYNDFDTIDEKYEVAVLGAKSLNLMNGDNKGNFNPKNSLTRAEAAAVVFRYQLMLSMNR